MLGCHIMGSSSCGSPSPSRSDHDSATATVSASYEERKSSATCFNPTTTTVHLPKSTSWLQALISTHFFRECPHHCGQLKAEEHFFCLCCYAVMCQYCLPLHRQTASQCQGPCFQVYRYMYHDVIRVADIAPLVDVSGIQQYQANGHPAVHLRPKSIGLKKAKSPVSFTSRCGGCNRSLTPQWKYCSILCSKTASPKAVTSEIVWAEGGGQEANSFGVPSSQGEQFTSRHAMHLKNRGCQKRKWFKPQRSDLE